MIDYGSVCSGIESATVAVHPLGWKAAWFAEIEPFPCAVLAHHYPDVANLGDMTQLPREILAGRVHAPSLLVGGTPCQDFSVAGMRLGLEGERGQLTIKFVETADAIDHVRTARGDDECIVWWENVPGVLSDKANAFGCFLAALVGESDALQPAGGKWSNAGCVYGPTRTAAWRVLDAQYFGLAQRRRRVFVVASARAGFDPAAVLFERDGVRRDNPPSRQAPQDIAGTIAGGARSSGGYSTDDIPMTVGTLTSHAYSGGAGGRPEGATAGHFLPVTADPVKAGFIVGPLTAGCGPNGHGGSGLATDKGAEAGHILAFGGNNQSGPIDVATARNACASASGRMDFESETFVVHAIQAGALRTNPDSGPDGIGVQADHAYTIEARAEVQAIQAGAQVRRLTPMECERLQGFPDNYTRIPMRLYKQRKITKNRPADMWEKVEGGWMLMAADGPRYKAIGNSKATTVVQWIAKRIDAQARMLEHANDNNPATADRQVG